MAQNIAPKRAVAFIDGSNTRLAARKAFGELYANFHPLALALAVCEQRGWELQGVRFYLGVPDLKVNEDGHYAWMKRCARWQRQGVTVFTRVLRMDQDGIAREKGIDVRLALDAVDQLRRAPFDVALIFSQDQDFAELADEMKRLAGEDGRPLEIASVFPASERVPAGAGIRGTEPIPLPQAVFARTLDDAENRKRQFTAPGKEEAETPQAAEPAGPDEPVEDIAPEISPEPDMPSHVPVVPTPIWAVQRRPSRIMRAVRLLVATYGLGAAVTFGMLIWHERTHVFAPVTTVAAGQERAAEIGALSLRALLWPETWMTRTEYAELAQAVDRLDLRPIQSYADHVIGKLKP